MLYHTPRSFWTRCQFCNQHVFYYENDFGSKVFFDDLGPPWPKHNCPERQAQFASRKAPLKAGRLKVERGRQIKSINNYNHRRHNRRKNVANPLANRDIKPSGVHEQAAKHDLTVRCQGVIAFKNDTADIFKVANIRPGSFGASLLGRFSKEPLVQLTVHSPIHGKGRGQKLGFTFFIGRSIAEKLNLKKGMQVAAKLRGVAAIPSHPIWVCDQLNC